MLLLVICSKVTVAICKSHEQACALHAFVIVSGYLNQHKVKVMLLLLTPGCSSLLPHSLELVLSIALLVEASVTMHSIAHYTL